MENKYLALYRQYRPNKFSDVQGQEHIITTLTNIIKSQKIGHAYLFSGPHGTGKTSVAKIFANTINCMHSNDLLIPCENCINNVDKNLDIIEIDAASNTGIEDIRELKEKIKHLPTNSRYKIYIIDEVHMLSKAAFNALLKTLEEPPKHAIFILATTDPQKIPLTILSRVQRFNFKKIEQKVIVNHLKKVYDQENIKYEKEAINLIASLGNGSLRDALSIADQSAIFVGDGVVKLEDVEKLFGITNVENIINLINLAAAHKVKEILELSNTLVDNGADIERLVSSLIYVLKDFIVITQTHSNELLEFINLDQCKKINISNDKAREYIAELINLFKEIKLSDLPQQSLELGLIKLATLSTHDENFTNEIELPKEIKTFGNKNITELNNIEEEDFQMASELKEDTSTKKIKSRNKSQLNDIFSFSSISNKSDYKTTIIDSVDIDDAIQKTDELILKEKTEEFEMNDFKENTITLDTTITNPIEINKTNEEVIPGAKYEFISDELLHDLVFVNQIEKKDKTKEDLKYKDKDKLSLSLMDKTLSDGRSDQIVLSMLKDMKVILSGKDFIVFTSNIKSKVKNLNINANDLDILEVIKKVFGRYVHIFAITHEQQVEATEWWKNIGKNDTNRKIKKLYDIKEKINGRPSELKRWAEATFDKTNFTGTKEIKKKVN